MRPVVVHTEYTTPVLDETMEVNGRIWERIIRGYVFWTLFFGIGPTIWFYPLNELDITGYEVFVLVLLVPVFLEISLLRRFLQSHIGSLLLSSGSLFGILSYLSPTTFTRLCLLTTGTGFAVLQFTADFMFAEPFQRKLAYWGYTVGYLLLISTRILWRTLTPAWTDTSSCLLVTSFGLVGIAKHAMGFRDRDNNLPYGHNPTDSPGTTPRPPIRGDIRWPFVGAGLGSLLFLVHWIFGEVSVLSRWTVSGYPRHGPSPNPYGLLVFASVLKGLLVLAKMPSLICGKLWMVTASLSFIIVYKVPGLQGFLAGLIVALFTFSSWPLLFSLFAHCPQARTLCLAALVYIVEMFYLVWTIAYNFVPGGEYTREFTGLLIAVVLACICGAVYTHRNSTALNDAHYVPFTETANAHKIKVSRMVTLISLCYLIGCAGMGVRYMRYDPQRSLENTVNESPKTITAMIWTYRFAYDNEGWPSLERTVKLIEDLGVDVIVLLETDASKPFMGSNDLCQWLAERLNMFSDFGPSTKSHTWGNMLLSKYPILQSEHHLLPSPHGELAPAISATLNVSGRHVAVVLSHMGNDHDNLDRQLQAQFLSNLTAVYIEAQRLPIIFLGYVTSRPRSRDYLQFIGPGKLHDIDETDRDRFCEYIFYSRLKRLGYARLTHGGLTDTEIQVGRFEITGFCDSDANGFSGDGRKLSTSAAHALPGAQFNPVFGDYTVGRYYGNRHHYHMNTPKYFVPA